MGEPSETRKAESISVPRMAHIKASETSPPPAWALAQRRVFGIMEEAARLTVEKYADPGGVPYYADDVDDIYERFYDWGLFYAMCGEEEVLRFALREYNAITRSNDDRTQNPHFAWLFPQLHNEYYSLDVPQGQQPSWIPGQRIITDWHHMGEGNELFYSLGLADPTVSENVRRARRFAAMMIGEDPEAPNYNADLNQFRSVYTDAKGPIYEVNVEQVKGFLHGGSPTQPNWMPDPMGSRATLYPVIKQLEPDWYRTTKRAKQVVDLFNKIIMRGDIPHNLGATALVTNAYLYTGDEKYRKWVLRYTEGWLDRMRRNKGIVPDNIGASGEVGEDRDGQWWGGWYGWNCYKGNSIGLTSMTIAAECAHLLSGDAGYLELLRSQMELLFENTRKRDDGQLLVSWRYGPDGWFDYKPMVNKWLPNLYFASLSDEDRQMMEQVRDGDAVRDWGMVQTPGAHAADVFAFFQYHDGKFPDWPEKAMTVELEGAIASLEAVRAESRVKAQIIADNRSIPNPVRTEVLTQMMFGAPGTVYNGGLLRATVRYFDPDRARPGLPLDVAALVDELKPDRSGILLVNLSRHETRKLIVQAGAFGEHQFTEVRYANGKGEHRVPLDGKYFAVELPPSTSIRVGVGLRRFANDPSYAFPWHGGKIPVPFQ